MPNEPNEERKFIHDVANTLGVAMLVAGCVLEKLQEKNQELSNPLILEQMAQICRALEKMKTMLLSRREVIIKKAELEKAS